jgi:hypothetical protein
VRKKKKRSVASQAPLYYFNVNRTSLDHLLLGVNADVNKCVASWFGLNFRNRDTKS